MQEFIPIRHILLEIATVMILGGDETAVIKSTVFEKNNGALNTANAVNINPRTKHISVKYHISKNRSGKGSVIALVKVDTLLRKADIFTKGMARRSL